MNEPGMRVGAADRHYEDTVQPWLKLFGPSAEILVQAVTMTLGLHPLGAWVKNREEARDRILSALARKVQDFPPALLIAPRPIVAQSAIEGMAGTQEDPELFDQFANLLANAMVGQRAHDVHPGFPAILKHLSAAEAHLTRWLLAHFQAGHNKSVPCLQLTAPHTKNNAEIVLFISFYMGATPHAMFNNDSMRVAASLHNLERLGLIQLPKFVKTQPVSEGFSSLEAEPFVQSLLQSVEQEPSVGKGQLSRGYMALTDFGILFFKACLIPPAAQGG